LNRDIFGGEVNVLIFVSLGKMRKKPDKPLTADATERMEGQKQKGIKILNWYWTLGRYDVIVVFEAPNEKEALKFNLRFADIVATETMVAIPRQEAIQLL
jgi:uncharacterized protein with GYD domain